MSYEILVQDLRRKSEEKIKNIWDDVRRDADELRTEKRKEFELAKKVSRTHLKEVEHDVISSVLLDAERKAIRIDDEARKKLADRLQTLAGQLLGQIREGEYELLFSGFVKELPDAHWQQVRVNPLDRKLAVQYFQDAEITTDKDIVGGFEACDDSGTFRVIATLEKRFDNAFPHILPLLMKEILELDDAAAS